MKKSKAVKKTKPTAAKPTAAKPTAAEPTAAEPTAAEPVKTDASPAEIAKRKGVTEAQIEKQNNEMAEADAIERRELLEYRLKIQRLAKASPTEMLALDKEKSKGLAPKFAKYEVLHRELKEAGIRAQVVHDLFQENNWRLTIDGEEITYRQHLDATDQSYDKVQRMLKKMRDGKKVKLLEKGKSAEEKKTEAEEKKIEADRKEAERLEGVYQRTEPKFLEHMRKHKGRAPCFGSEMMSGLSKEALELFQKRLGVKIEKDEDGEPEFYVMSPPFEPWKPPAAVGEVMPKEAAALAEPAAKKVTMLEGEPSPETVDQESHSANTRHVLRKNDVLVIAGNECRVPDEPVPSCISPKGKDGKRHVSFAIELIENEKVAS